MPLPITPQDNAQAIQKAVEEFANYRGRLRTRKAISYTDAASTTSRAGSTTHEALASYHPSGSSTPQFEKAKRMTPERPNTPEAELYKHLENDLRLSTSVQHIANAFKSAPVGTLQEGEVLHALFSCKKYDELIDLTFARVIGQAAQPHVMPIIQARTHEIGMIPLGHLSLPAYRHALKSHDHYVVYATTTFDKDAAAQQAILQMHNEAMLQQQSAILDKYSQRGDKASQPDIHKSSEVLQLHYALLGLAHSSGYADHLEASLENHISEPE